ncbi:indolethylamine N-methyltransferase-like [Ixodes scapularis]
MSSQELKNSHKEQFVGRTYVDRYVAGKFSSSQAEKLHRFFHSDLIQGETLLDVGSGPVILNALMTSGRFKHIVLSDLVEDNRLELKKWMNRDEDAIDWSFFAEKIAAVEGYRFWWLLLCQRHAPDVYRSATCRMTPSYFTTSWTPQPGKNFRSPFRHKWNGAPSSFVSTDQHQTLPHRVYSKSTPFRSQSGHDIVKETSMQSRLFIQGETLLDAGSGPVILNALMTSGRFKLIELSDLVEDNRLELKKWMNRDEDAIDWSLFAEKIAAVEGYSDIKKGAIEILERTRAAIHNVVPCGVLERGVLPVEHRENFDVVISSGCLESAAVDVESYRRVVCNVVTLAKPGGLLVIFGVGGLNEYQVGSADFTVMNLTENVLKEAMTDAGLQIELYRPHKIGSFLGSSDVFIFNMVVRKA